MYVWTWRQLFQVGRGRVPQGRQRRVHGSQVQPVKWHGRVVIGVDRLWMMMMMVILCCNTHSQIAVGSRDDCICIYSCSFNVTSKSQGRSTVTSAACALRSMHKLRGHSATILGIGESIHSFVFVCMHCKYLVFINNCNFSGSGAVVLASRL